MLADPPQGFGRISLIRHTASDGLAKALWRGLKRASMSSKGITTQTLDSRLRGNDEKNGECAYLVRSARRNTRPRLRRSMFSKPKERCLWGDLFPPSRSCERRLRSLENTLSTKSAVPLIDDLFVVHIVWDLALESRDHSSGSPQQAGLETAAQV